MININSHWCNCQPRIKKAGITLLVILNISVSYSQIRPSNDRTRLLQREADLMGQAFLKGDYKIFTSYVYPAIVSATGGQSRLETTLLNTTSKMRAQGMTFDKIVFDNPTKMVKSGNELQCTLQQHTTIKLSKGSVIATSTLIAISKDGGKNWRFVDTSNKDVTTIRKVLTNLSTAIIIPPQQKPAFYSF